MQCSVCLGVGRCEPPPPTSGFGRGPMESWPTCETCNGTGSPVNPTRSDEGTGKSGLMPPQFARLVVAADAFQIEADAVLSGEISRDWADHYGPLFEKLCDLRDALADARGQHTVYASPKVHNQ